MNVDINSQIKPLVSNLLRVHIGQYLKTTHFDHFVLEHDLDKAWESHKKYIRDQSNIIILGFDPSGDYEDAFQLMLHTYFVNDKKQFFELVYLVLGDFIKWDNGKRDFSKTLNDLALLGIEKEKLLTLNTIAEITKERVSIPDQKNPNQSSPKFEQAPLQIDDKLCFVIMPFTDKLNPIYDNIIKPVTKELKLKSLRADEIFSSKPIIEDVWNNIKRAKFLIADLTERNPNVFYELGLAHAFNKEVVLITQDLLDVPFDLRHFRIIVYKDSISGADTLKSTLKEYIKEVGSKNS